MLTKSNEFIKLKLRITLKYIKFTQSQASVIYVFGWQALFRFFEKNLVLLSIITWQK